MRVLRSRPQVKRMNATHAHVCGWDLPLKVSTVETRLRSTKPKHMPILISGELDWRTRGTPPCLLQTRSTAENNNLRIELVPRPTLRVTSHFATRETLHKHCPPKNSASQRQDPSLLNTKRFSTRYFSMDVPPRTRTGPPPEKS